MPSTDKYQFPYEALTDQPGWSLHGGLAGNQPILAEEVDRELARVESEADDAVSDLRTDLDILEGAFRTTGVQMLDYINTGSGTNTTEFVNIPQTFRHLSVVWYGQSDGSGQIDSLAVRFNGDGGDNYISRLTRNTESDAFSSSSGTFSVLRLGYVGTSRSCGVFHVPAYRDAVTKYAHGTAFARGSSGGANTFNIQGGGYWSSVAAIQSIRIWPSSQLWSGNPRISLIGWP